MSEGKLTLEVVTPAGVALREEVDAVEAPSADGEVGILPGHLPLLAGLRAGIVTYHQGAEETRVAVAEGFLEVIGEKTLLLSDRLAKKSEIDPVQVRLDLKDADEALDKFAGEPGSPEWRALVAKQVWAAVQLELHGDPPAATHRPFEEYGAAPPPDEGDVDYPEPKDALEADVETHHPTQAPPPPR